MISAPPLPSPLSPVSPPLECESPLRSLRGLARPFDFNATRAPAAKQQWCATQQKRASPLFTPVCALWQKEMSGTLAPSAARCARSAQTCMSRFSPKCTVLWRRRRRCMTVPLPARDGGADAETGLTRDSSARAHRGGGARCVSTIIGECRRQRPARARDRHLITRVPYTADPLFFFGTPFVIAIVSHGTSYSCLLSHVK